VTDCPVNNRTSESGPSALCSQDRIRTCMITYELNFTGISGLLTLSLLLTLIHTSTNSAT
jgi:hypothetical protein